MRECSPLKRVTCHVLHVTCHMSRAPFFFLSFFLDKVLELIGGGSVINRATPSSLNTGGICIFRQDSKTVAGSKVSFTGRIQISLLSTPAQMSFKRKISTPDWDAILSTEQCSVYRTGWQQCMSHVTCHM